MIVLVVCFVSVILYVFVVFLCAVLFFVFVFFFFFKQKTAYEIYQCDWSSDVCSSDLEYRKRPGFNGRPDDEGHWQRYG